MKCKKCGSKNNCKEVEYLFGKYILCEECIIRLEKESLERCGDNEKNLINFYEIIAIYKEIIENIYFLQREIEVFDDYPNIELRIEFMDDDNLVRCFYKEICLDFFIKNFSEGAAFIKKCAKSEIQNFLIELYRGQTKG
jgi:hypothetical protein